MSITILVYDQAFVDQINAEAAARAEAERAAAEAAKAQAASSDFSSVLTECHRRLLRQHDLLRRRSRHL